MSKIKRVEDIQVWQKARELNIEIYKITNNSFMSKDFTLCNQIRKASISIMANIAEGYGRRSNKEFTNFLNIAHGSSAELQSHLYIALDLKYVNPKDFSTLYEKINKVSKMIQAFMNYLKNS